MSNTRMWLTAALVLTVTAFVHAEPAKKTDGKKTEPKLDPALQKIKDLVESKTKNVKTFTADMEMTTVMAQRGMKMKMQAHGTLKGKRNKGGQYLTRAEIEATMSMPGAQMPPMTSKILSINDGKNVYMLTEQMGMKQAMKRDAPKDQSESKIGWDMIGKLTEKYTLKALADEKIEKQDHHVVEATAKPDLAKADASMQHKFKFFINKDTGVISRQQAFDADGNEIQKVDMKNVKLNPKIDDEQFVFTAPPGVTVRDIPAMPGMGL